MPQSLFVAAIQMTSTLDKAANLAAAERLVAEAAGGGASLVLLPELCDLYGDLRLAAESASPIPGPVSNLFAAWAKRHRIWLCGSISERVGDSGRAYNSAVLFESTGQFVTSYRKRHLFDAELPSGVSVRESLHFVAGEENVCVAAPFTTLGLAICYDLRFPEQFRSMMERGMTVLLLPSAFTRSTGRDHWEVLVRARAIENQCFVIAANQTGRHTARSESYGHSMIVDPWGRMLAEADGRSEGVIYAALDFDVLEDIRRRLPALRHR